MKGQRTERLIRITSKFLSAPSSQISLTALADNFEVSKTVISDDVSMVNDALTMEGLGRLVVDRGRTGGAFYIPSMSAHVREKFFNELASLLSAPDRLLPGGLIYYADVLFNPVYTDMLGIAFATDFKASQPTLVMTSEVKGIPLGLATARALGIPLAVCRFRNRPSDGPAVCVHYPTQSGEVRTMYMGTKMISPNDRVLIIDDFMRGGSTASGMCQVIHEFRAELVGIGAFIVVDEPSQKAVSDYRAL
ncbi:MAG: phosphoribosyltransferase family protein, partial [Pyramidobacter sp.]|nr:phosphoribosyltransferase family protein [Pyramidobacter sp.]